MPTPTFRVTDWTTYQQLKRRAETHRLTIGELAEKQSFERVMPYQCPKCGAPVFSAENYLLFKLVHDVGGCGGKPLPLPQDPDHTYEELVDACSLRGVQCGLDAGGAGITLVRRDGGDSRTVATIGEAWKLATATDFAVVPKAVGGGASAPHTVGNLLDDAAFGAKAAEALRAGGSVEGAVAGLVAAAEAKAEPVLADAAAPDPYAELKRAHAAGAKIEATADFKEWRVCVPEWRLPPKNYRVSKSTKRSVLRALGLTK